MSQQQTERKNQSLDQPHVQRDETRRLEVFVGKWNTEGVVVTNVDTSDNKIVATDTYEWLPGKYSIIHYADSSVGGEKINAIEIIGYDPSRKAYFGPFFDSQGGAGWEEITFEGNTWTWRGENVMGVRYHRCKAIFSEDGNVLNARHEQSGDGVNWQPWMDVKLTKIK
jgi:hypothetical protein